MSDFFDDQTDETILPELAEYQARTEVARRRAVVLLGLPGDRVVLDGLRRAAVERVLEGEWMEVDLEDLERVEEVWESTEREWLLRGETLKGGAL